MTTAIPPLRQPTVARIDFLEGLRGFLAIYVMFAHIGYFVGLSRLEKPDVLFPGWPALVFNYFDLSGWDAVNMFMILSGFVIFHLLNKGGESYPAYIIRRFFRLWPVFIICIVLGVLTFDYYGAILEHNPWSQNSWILKMTEVVVAIRQNGILPYFLCDLPMLHGLVSALVLPEGGTRAFSSLAWCISTEWQFYLCAPLFYWVTKNMTEHVAADGIRGFLAMRSRHAFDFGVNGANSLLPLQLHWFFLGMICYRAYREVEGKGLTGRSRMKIGLAVAFAVGISIFKPRLAPAALAWQVAFAALIATAQKKRTVMTRLMTGVFDHPVSRYFGRISYPVYLIHWPVSILVITALMKLYPGSTWSMAYLILMIGGAGADVAGGGASGASPPGSAGDEPGETAGGAVPAKGDGAGEPQLARRSVERNAAGKPDAANPRAARKQNLIFIQRPDYGLHRFYFAAAQKNDAGLPGAGERVSEGGGGEAGEAVGAGLLGWRPEGGLRRDALRRALARGGGEYGEGVWLEGGRPHPGRGLRQGVFAVRIHAGGAGDRGLRAGYFGVRAGTRQGGSAPVPEAGERESSAVRRRELRSGIHAQYAA